MTRLVQAVLGVQTSTQLPQMCDKEGRWKGGGGCFCGINTRQALKAI